MLELQCPKCHQRLLIDVALNCERSTIRIGEHTARVPLRTIDFLEPLIDAFPHSIDRFALTAEVEVATNSELGEKNLDQYVIRFNRAFQPLAVISTPAQNTRQLVLHPSIVAEKCRCWSPTILHGVGLYLDSTAELAGRRVELYGQQMQLFSILLKAYPEPRTTSELAAVMYVDDAKSTRLVRICHVAAALQETLEAAGLPVAVIKTRNGRTLAFAKDNPSCRHQSVSTLTASDESSLSASTETAGEQNVTAAEVVA